MDDSQVFVDARNDVDPLASPRKTLNAESTRQVEPNVEMATLFLDHSATLVRALRRTFGSGPPDPEDIAQQAFQKLVERQDRSDIRDLPAFLWRTARNAFLSALKRDGVRARYDYEVEQLYFPSRGDDLTPERVLEVREQLQSINDVLRQMPEKRRHAFLLHKVEGLSVAEVARRLDITRTPAQKHITRAAQQIDVFLAEKNKLRRTE
ncbi:MAG: sigma-70 family RNA polymerase sigma factor [Pseudomonadota bacterium]